LKGFGDIEEKKHLGRWDNNIDNGSSGSGRGKHGLVRFGSG
jgi:hypothetical protein